MPKITKTALIAAASALAAVMTIALVGWALLFGPLKPGHYAGKVTIVVRGTLAPSAGESGVDRRDPAGLADPTGAARGR